MIENILTVGVTILFVYTLTVWLKMAKRANKVIDEFEKINNENSDKCDYSPSDKWLDKHMD
jgi:hypothetical protein